MCEEVNLDYTPGCDISESSTFICFYINQGNLSIRIMEVHAEKLLFILPLEHDKWMCSRPLIPCSRSVILLAIIEVLALIYSISKSKIRDSLPEAKDFIRRQFKIKSDEFVSKNPF